MVLIENVLKSQVALGSAGFSGKGGGYGFGHVNSSEVSKIIDLSIDQNISLIDTAPIYGFGSAEN